MHNIQYSNVEEMTQTFAFMLKAMKSGIKALFMKK